MNIVNTFKNNANLKGIIPLIGSIIAGVLTGACLLGIVIPQTTSADFNTTSSRIINASNEAAQKAVKTIQVVVTAYSSTVDQTDSTPFITASGERVKDGIVANNLLPLGTKIKIPTLYGNKIFVVEDRMNRDKSNYHIDIWMPSKPLAVNFGIKVAKIEVLEN